MSNNISSLINYDAAKIIYDTLSNDVKQDILDNEYFKDVDELDFDTWVNYLDRTLSSTVEWELGYDLDRLLDYAISKNDDYSI